MTLLPDQFHLQMPARRAEEQVLYNLLETAQLHRERQPRRALQEALAARRVALKLGRESELAWALLWAGSAAARLGRLKLAVHLGESALRLFTALRDGAGQGGAENLLGVTAHEQGDLSAAYSRFRAALVWANESDDRLLEITVLGNLSLTTQVLGDIENALRWTLAALALASDEQTEPARARLLLGSVGLSLTMNQPQQAQEHAQQAQEIVDRLNLSGLEMGVLTARSQVAEQLGDAQAAVQLGRQAIRVGAQLGAALSEVVQAQLQLGRALLLAGEAQEASDVLLSAQESAAQAGHTELEVAATIQYGQAQRQQGHLALAREMMNSAAREARFAGCRTELTSALLGLAEVEEQAGNPQAALSAFRQYHALDRLLFGERQARLTQALLVTHEVEQHRRLSAQLEAANQELSFAAHHDGLTGAMNRRAFLDALEGAISASSQGAGFSLVLFDLDHFKEVNDHFGHAAGDEVLREVVKICHRTLREGDVVCRWGGEEFAALLPSTPLSGAQVVVERLRDQLQTHPWKDLHPALRVSASFGVGEWMPGERSGEELLARIDGALYTAKHTGRNRVVVCSVEQSVMPPN